MPVHLALIALLSLPLPWGHAPKPADPRHFGAWTLNVRVDSFSTGHVCKLSRPGAEYRRQAVVFHLSPNVDTSQAVYRIDAGAPRAVRDDQVTLARLGFALNNDDLDNPSGGLVRIPVDQLLGAAAVRIETTAFGRARKFDIAGLKPALAAAGAAGCRDEDFQ
jgi:hypothetical protein